MKAIKLSFQSGDKPSMLQALGQKFPGDQISYVDTPEWWNLPNPYRTPPEEENIAASATKTLRKLGLKVKKSMSFRKTRDTTANSDEWRGNYFNSEWKPSEVMDITRERKIVIDARIAVEENARSGKLRKAPSLFIDRQVNHQALERMGMPLPARPALKAMSTTPDLRAKNRRDSQLIDFWDNDNDAKKGSLSASLRTASSSTVATLASQETASEECHARSLKSSPSVSTLSSMGSSYRFPDRPRKPSKVTFKNVPPYNSSSPIPPVPPLPPGAAKPRIPSQQKASAI